MLETKQQDGFIRDRCAELGFDHFITVPPQGLSGSIAILWRKVIFLSVISRSSNIVDCFVDFNGINFYLSFVYSNPNRSERNQLWELLQRISTTRQTPWLIMGDFNRIRSNAEKRGGPLRAESTFQTFRKMIETCDFHDLKSIGDRFSWYGKRYSHDIYCCIDRSMANQEYMAMFPSA